MAAVIGGCRRWQRRRRQAHAHAAANVQAAQMQAIRNASSWAGNPPPGVVTTSTYPQLVPGGGTPKH
jgi:hypothetical protein